ncbi:unnamed protein product [Prunus armeniaca]|uniref:Uncharacterized protein n=1 Tax=Prunus armeniaca TaxID=36596 RepID=A0A6J5TWZ0_PRUAR|nr:hypothetical protein GBA52_009027 [Prunus armeniaca]CAB4268269.1 unnamed protein product [Prunus armeniaca]
MRVGKAAVIWGNLLRSKFKMTVVVSEEQHRGVITIKIHPHDLATLSKQAVSAPAVHKPKLGALDFTDQDRQILLKMHKNCNEMHLGNTLP